MDELYWTLVPSPLAQEHPAAPRLVAELPLTGAGGERVDLWRTVRSHGVAELPPAAVDEAGRTLDVTLAPDGAAPFRVRIAAGAGTARVLALGEPPPEGVAAAAVARLLRLDEDLSGFYAQALEDAELAWAAETGAGRMLRCGSVFEDVVKTVCTTNCAWSATERMVGALVAHLGRPPAGLAGGGAENAFPTPEAMAEAPESFYRDVVRAGYRGRYLVELARSVAAGEVDLEELGRLDHRALPDAELAARLQALPGVGPYATAHIMMMLGRYSRLILDSWTRPTYRRLSGRRRITDVGIERRFRRYGRYRGLAFWLYLTRGWVEAQEPPPVEPAAE